MKEFLKKLTSRKFIASMIGVIVGVAVALGADGDTIASVSGAVVSLISAVAYIVMEGKVDAAAVESVVYTFADDEESEED